ncbi:MAG: hypothetical protein JJD98_19945 [Polaromonas sp.]|nr:hypothetical protein [Polaromonas sp.]
MKDRWDHFEHDADIGMRGFGMTKAGASEQAKRRQFHVHRKLARLSPLICIKG